MDPPASPALPAMCGYAFLTSTEAPNWPRHSRTQDEEGTAPDGAAELVGMMLEPGTSLGVANSFEGIPANARTKTSTKTATTVITQGVASRSLRGGSVPR